MKDSRSLQILHISDLHIKEKEHFDRTLVLNPLIERVRKDKKQGLGPELVVVTGDIAFKGVKEEYDQAKTFFDDLLQALGLENERLFIVPGNHDVNRKKYRKSDVLQYENMRDLNEELENDEFRADLLKGMNDYFSFMESSYPHLRIRHDRLIPFVNLYEAECGRKIQLVGLNSAWMCRKSPDEREIAIGEYQVANAVGELKDDISLRIFLFHHPLSWLRPEDRNRCRQHINDSILLTGHLHEVEGGFSSDLDVRFYQFQAGGAYLGSESNRPARYHYITFDWDENLIKLDFRKFVKDKGKWAVDGDTGNDGQKSFPMSIDAMGEETQASKKDDIFNNYLRYAASEHRHLPMQGFETNLRTPIEIEKVYVNMRAHIQAHDFEFTKTGRQRQVRKFKEEQLSSLTIKDAFEAARKRKIKDMVILGDPGSGKTTLLKYILLMLIDGKGKEKIGIDNSTIPFFAPLRDLKDPDKDGPAEFIKRACCLDGYGISDEALVKLLDGKRAIILLDGLDEVADEKARIRTCRWIDRARKQYVNTRFVITSRYAGYVGKSRLEGSVLELSIRDFNPDEVEAFLVRWFETVEAALHPEDEERWKEKGRDDARTLVEEIDKSDHIRKLAVNPLLLQIIALVRRDRGTVLPQRRVELYQECINVLLEKWDMAKGLDIMLTAREAREILQPVALWMHEKDERRSAPAEMIKEKIREPLEKIGKSGIDPEKLLLNIRDRSGVFMGYSESEFGFTHLSFQEYLAAEQIRNTGKIETLITNYSRRWWREVILLTLALNNPSVIEEFMDRIVSTEHFMTDIGLVLDAVGDSIIKPSEPFLNAVKNKKLSDESRANAMRVLRQIGGDPVTLALKAMVKSREKRLAESAFAALVSLDAAEGLVKPVMEEIPTIITNPLDDSKMVLVPAGTFLYGSREDDKIAGSDEKPQRTIKLDAFYMDMFPVTNEQFCEFLNKSASDKASLGKWIWLEGEYKNERCRISRKGNIYRIQKGYEQYPVIYVPWYGAEAYAAWAGKRLPTEQEWEKAARGTEGGIYPWGDRFDKTLCNSEESGIGGVTPVDQFPDGRSPYGCHDMAGNIWEWTNSWYDKDKDDKILRGGSFFLGSYGCRCAARFYDHPYFGVRYVGFRCARIYT